MRGEGKPDEEGYTTGDCPKVTDPTTHQPELIRKLLRDAFARVNICAKELQSSVQPTPRRSLGFGARRVESLCNRVQAGRGAVPSQLIHVLEERDVGPERGERSEQQRPVALARE